MKKICLFGVLLVLSILNGKSQVRNLHYGVGASGGFTTPGQVPFWLRSNLFGSIPLDNASLSFMGSIRKDYDTAKTRIFDWGASVEGRSNVGYKSDFSLIEGYAKLRVSVFEIRAGRSKEIMGLCDTSLSSGAFAVAGNALGIPKVQIGIPEFYSLPIFDKLFAFKGNYAHGWIGKVPSRLMNDSIERLKTYFHQTSLYGRLGKPSWKWKLYGGFNHEVFWGSLEKYYGSDYTLSPFEAYIYVITGRPYGSKIGNHLGSIDVGFEYEFRNVRLLLYRQNLYDIGALYYLANIRDGLNGLSLVNTGFNDNRFHWKKILVEVFFTKNQAGEFWSPQTPSGDENYYNNDQYLDGWSYKGIGIGNPFICSQASAREGLPSDPIDYFINNRVVAFHLGYEGAVQKWAFILKTSYSLNYGTYGTSEEGHTMQNMRDPPRYGIFGEKKQFSGYIEANRELKRALNFGIIGAFDTGELYNDSFGMLLKLSKSF